MTGEERGPTAHPIERLGRWNGREFEPVAPHSVGGPVFVMCHGWARGLRPAVRAAGGHLKVWDESATTESGSRFDGWYGPLANAIEAFKRTGKQRHALNCRSS